MFHVKQGGKRDWLWLWQDFEDMQPFDVHILEILPCEVCISSKFCQDVCISSKSCHVSHTLEVLPKAGEGIFLRGTPLLNSFSEL